MKARTRRGKVRHIPPRKGGARKQRAIRDVVRAARTGRSRMRIWSETR